MKRTLTIGLLLVAIAGPAAAIAAQPAPLDIRELAAVTGLTERQVQMVVGAHTAYAEYLTTYNWARGRFIKTLGHERYEMLMAGRPIRLDDGTRIAIARDF